jgi:hypothetical protein
VDLARLALDDSARTPVRGHHAVLARDEADARSVLLQWPEPPGLLVGGSRGVRVVDGAAASVTVEAPGRPTVAAELHVVEGWAYRAFVAFLRVDLGDQAQVVTRLVDGTEVGREPLGALAGSKVSTDVDYTEECVTDPDGTTECSTSGAGGATEATITAPERSGG